MDLFRKHDKGNKGKLSKEEFEEYQKELIKKEVKPSLINKISKKNFSREISKVDFLKFYDDVYGQERSQVAEILRDNCPEIPTPEITKALELFEKYDLDVKIETVFFSFDLFSNF